MTKKKTISQKFWHDKNDQFVTNSKYDLFLHVWLGAFIFSMLVGSNSLVRFLSFVGWISIIIWGTLEIFTGASYFRRLIGLLVLLMVVATRFI